MFTTGLIYNIGRENCKKMFVLSFVSTVSHVVGKSSREKHSIDTPLGTHLLDTKAIKMGGVRGWHKLDAIKHTTTTAIK